MRPRYFIEAGYRALTAEKRGPTLYDLCDPLLRGSGPGDAHIRKFYATALGNLALRPLLARAGLPQLRDPARFRVLQDALTAARDQKTPDWRAIGTPLAELIDEYPQQHPKPSLIPRITEMPSVAEIDRVIRACSEDLTRAFAKRGFIPAYAAFNLIGDPDFRGRDLLIALEGLNARTYKNATLLFNLARVFVLANAPTAALINPPWTGIAEPMWEPVQIRHRSAYYDAFFAEALMDFLDGGGALPHEVGGIRHTIGELIDFCLTPSRERVRARHDGSDIDVVTALAPPPNTRLSPFFWKLKSDLGFGLYVPDCDTTACSLSAAAQFGSDDPILNQPMLDFYAGYQVGNNRCPPPSVAINDNIDYEGGIVTWIENHAGDQPFGNDLDPTLNLDVLEVSFRNHARWQIVEQPQRLETLRRIVRFQSRLAASGAFADPRAHIYYLPELYCAYFGRCYAAFRAMPIGAQHAIDPDGSFELIRRHVLAYVTDELIIREMSPFDAALALLALAKLGADTSLFAAPLDCIVRHFGEGRRRASYKAYEWNKMKTPTRILVGGAEVTSAFVLSALAHARKALLKARHA